MAVAVLCLIPLAVVPAGCKLFRKAPLQSTVNTRDPRTAGQLLDGFYGVEAAAWRWSAKRFSVKLKTPAGAAQKGATLKMVLTVPPAVIENSTSVTLSASVGSTALPPETFSSTGEFTYRRDVPANLLAGPDAIVEFELDKSFKPGGPDKRDLGLVITSVGLETR
jgi:hypothetical protein